MLKRWVSFFRAVFSLILTHIDTDWEPTTSTSQSTALTEPVLPTTSAMVRCACLTTKVTKSDFYRFLSYLWCPYGAKIISKALLNGSPAHTVCVCCVCPLGGAPNYYPNSFSAPEIQPHCVESRFQVSPDVARYNSSDEDNVTQVGRKKKKEYFTIFSQLCRRFPLVSSWMSCCSSYHCKPPVKHLTGWIQDSSPICVFCCRFAPSTPRCSTKRSARDSARTWQDPWRGLSSSSRNAWWVHTLSAHLWFALFSHSSVALYTCVHCFRVMNQNTFYHAEILYMLWFVVLSFLLQMLFLYL